MSTMAIIFLITLDSLRKMRFCLFVSSWAVGLHYDQHFEAVCRKKSSYLIRAYVHVCERILQLRKKGQFCYTFSARPNSWKYVVFYHKKLYSLETFSPLINYQIHPGSFENRLSLVFYIFPHLSTFVFSCSPAPTPLGLHFI